MTLPIAFHARFDDVALDHKHAEVVLTFRMPIEHFRTVVAELHANDVLITAARHLGVPDNTPYGPVAGDPTVQA